MSGRNCEWFGRHEQGSCLGQAVLEGGLIWESFGLGESVGVFAGRAADTVPME